MPNTHIMVVDDDADTLEYVHLLLGLHGYQVTPWSTSKHALEQITEYQPDLVLLDFRLDQPPNGLEILHALGNQAETVRIPVILYSSEGEFLRSHRDEVSAMGNEVLEKPFLPEELLLKIESLTST